jgi:hypothetical protein
MFMSLAHVVNTLFHKKKKGVMLLLCTVSGSHRLALRTAVLVSGLSYAPLLRNFSLSYFSNPPVFSDGQEEAKIRMTS